MRDQTGSFLTVLSAVLMAVAAPSAWAQLPPDPLAGPSQGHMSPVDYGVPQGLAAGAQAPMIPRPEAFRQPGQNAYGYGASQINQPLVQPPSPLAGDTPAATPSGIGHVAHQGAPFAPSQQFAQFEASPRPNAAMWYAPAGPGPAAHDPSAIYPASYWAAQQAAMAPQPLPPTMAAPIPAAYDAQTAGYYAAPGAAGWCPYCGGVGCEYCWDDGHTDGLLGGVSKRFFHHFLPYGEGGCCAPRWYDVTLEAMYLTREDVSRRVDFSSDGILGDIVLSTDSLDFDEQLGFRFTGAVQVFAGANVEFTYFGLFNWAETAQVTSEIDDLFSVISEFGSNPLNGFDETDRARLHRISYSQTIDNFELHIRKRWIGPNCRLQGSWLAGVRYVYLLEDFEYFTLGGDLDPVTPGLQSRGQMDYDVRARNSLTGFQLGGDLWTCVVPGISLGGELKGGVYGNYGAQGTNIVATTTDPLSGTTFVESKQQNDIALVAEGSLMFLYRTSPNWTLRAGYTFLYIDGVALAAENFNATPPFSQTRTVRLNDNGDLFFHGATAAIEWMW